MNWNPFRKRTGCYPTGLHLLHQVRGALYNLACMGEGTAVIIDKQLLIAMCKSLDKAAKDMEKKYENVTHTQIR